MCLNVTLLHFILCLIYYILEGGKLEDWWQDVACFCVAWIKLVSTARERWDVLQIPVQLMLKLTLWFQFIFWNSGSVCILLYKFLVSPTSTTTTTIITVTVITTTITTSPGGGTVLQMEGLRDGTGGSMPGALEVQCGKEGRRRKTELVEVWSHF